MQNEDNVNNKNGQEIKNDKYNGEIIEGKEITVYDMNPDAFHHSRTIKPIKVEKILVPHIIDGELAINLPSIKEKKDFIKDQLENKVWESELRPKMPHTHYVDLTEKVYELRENMYQKLHGGSLD